jgi:hypothetical protein
MNDTIDQPVVLALWGRQGCSRTHLVILNNTCNGSFNSGPKKP